MNLDKNEFRIKINIADPLRHSCHILVPRHTPQQLFPIEKVVNSVISETMPLTEDAIAAQQVQDRLKSLYQLVHEIEKKRQASESGITAITKLQTSPDEKTGQNYQVHED